MISNTTYVVDAHAHIFERSLAMVDGRRYTPDRDALLSEYLDQLDQNGFTHGVLVQPSFLGVNNDYLLAALRNHPDRLRGVAVVDPCIGSDGLAALRDQGIVGVRMNLPGRAIPDFRAGPWPGLQERLHRLGLHVEVHCESSELQNVLPSFIVAGNTIVIDHFGRPDPVLGMEDPGLRYLLSTASTGQVWVKLTAAYRLGRGDAASFTQSPVARSLISAMGTRRLVWGSDWPHTQLTGKIDFRKSRRLLDELVPDPDAQRRILGESAKELFRL